MQLSERRDARRLLAAIAAAVVVHVGLFFGIPFLTSLDTAPLPDYGPIVVRLEEPQAALELPKPAPEVKPAPSVRPSPVATAKPTPAAPATAKPAAPAAPKPATAAPAAPATTRAPGTSPFRQAGATTGTSAGAASESVVSGPPPVVLPAVGSSATTGTGEQRSGEAVVLTGRSAAGSGGSLESAKAKLDKSLAGATATGKPGTAAASGGGTGVTAAAADIEWENPGAAKGRGLLSAPLPRLPDWVKELGLDLEVRITFSVNADGLVTSPQVVHSSSNPSVDDACLLALRHYQFSKAVGAVAIKGSRTFRITQH
ncbi:MAG: TonB family protein [Spirochaetes bacterium]|nr:TonB family protein [Spirochaetota bacterium]